MDIYSELPLDLKRYIMSFSSYEVRINIEKICYIINTKSKKFNDDFFDLNKIIVSPVFTFSGYFFMIYIIIKLHFYFFEISFA
tara:strand:- start:8007 stop:8255 length:249 start_codon:yes stop_codon:yes gene_type:complete